jgi:hypothetical protein
VPADVAPYVAIIVEGFVAKHLTIEEAMRGVETLAHPFMIRSHPPTWLSLADLEWVCRNMPNFIGIQGGETLSTLYDEPRGRDNGDAEYHRCMPRNFWSLVFVMGISRGCGIYSLDGQTLMENPKETARFPHAKFPAAIWTTDGRTSDTFKQFVLPLMRGVIEHDLIPSREQVLQDVRLAVYSDKEAPGDGVAWPYYVEYGPLYAGTDGFRRISSIDGQLWEFFPNTGRYYYIPVLVQGDEALAPHVRSVPVSALQEVRKVRETFDAAYPRWYNGDALVSLVGDTLTVLNTHENQDVTETFSVPLDRGRFASISGTIGPHAYLVGKFKDDARRLWLQTNGEYPERTMTLALRCTERPVWRVEPAAAAEVRWDDATHTLTLQRLHRRGAVAVAIE